MSLTNTIAYEGPRARGVSARGIGILVAGPVLGAVVGLAAANSSTTTNAPEASVTGMALDDFIRLNTTSFNGLAPVAAAVGVESVSVDPGFLEINTTSFNGLAPVAGNVADPGFLEMNVGSFAAVTPAVGSWTVDPGFLEMNIGSLQYPTRGYTEPTSGIR